MAGIDKLTCVEIQFLNKVRKAKRQQTARYAGLHAIHSFTVSLLVFFRPAVEEAISEKAAKRLKTGCIEILADRPRNITAERVGPKAAIERLHLEDLSLQERAVWFENARIDAIVSPCRLSMASVRSGIRCWFTFIGAPEAF